MFIPLPILIPVPIPVPIPIDNLAEVIRKAKENPNQHTAKPISSEHGKDNSPNQSQIANNHQASNTSRRGESCSPKRYVLKQHMTSDEPE